MKLFLVKVGRNTRGGNFQELYSRAVAVSDKTDSNQVYGYFRPRYEGFEVQIKNVAVEDLSETIPETRPPMVRNDYGVISGFKIKYTEAEKQLSSEYFSLKDKTDEALRRLHSLIRARYEKLPYVEARGSIELETGPSESYGTTCRKLPVKSGDFFKVIKDCDDGTAELEITEKTTGDDENALDIPF